jgi:hypothetical protein
MTMHIHARATILSGSFVLGLAACYTVEFDEQKTDAYYCQSNTDCLETQACSQFRCVDNRGPHLDISGPEGSTELDPGTTSLDVLVDVSNLVLDEKNTVEDGVGKLLLTIDPHSANPITALVDTDSAQLDLGDGLDPGAHRLVAQAVFGDGTPYTNPSATTHRVFWQSDGTDRPQIAIMSPGPNHVHVANEPLEIHVASSGFTFVNLGDDCPVPPGCDPFSDDTCVPSVQDCGGGINTAGHTHIYLLGNYPDCLVTSPEQPISCNLDYIASIRQEGQGDNEVSAVIEAEKFPEPGNYVLTASTQYSNHAPYPNVDFVIYDQIPITIVER